MTAHDQPPASSHDPLGPGREMDAATCLHALSLLIDGRPVDPVLAERARAHAAAHPEIARVEADWRRMREALAASPGRRAREGFTEGVLAALAERAEAPVGSLRFARRLALAASLALAVTLGFDLASPASLQADAGMERARHAVDHFRDGPFDDDDVLGGLRARLADAGFAARGPAAADPR